MAGKQSEKTNHQNVNQKNMKINLQNENHVGKATHQSVGVKIAQTSRLPVIEKQIEKEQIQIQDWIEIISRVSHGLSVGL